MNLKAKNSSKISVLLLILPVFLFANVSVAKADIFSEMSSGVSTFIHFVVAGFSELQQSICNQSASSSDQSSFGQMQINLQKVFCGGYVSPTSVLSGQAVSSSSFDANNFFTFSIPGSLLPIAMPNVIPNTFDSSTNVFSSSSFSASNIFIVNSGNSAPAPATSTENNTQASLPGGLSGSTAQTGIDLNNSEIMYWTNIERNKNGDLSVLDENNTLDKIAKIRVEDMFAKQYFDHYSPTGDNVSLEANANNYSYITIGENIAMGNFGSSRDLVTAWMNSPGHRANILNTGYKEIGVAAEQGMYQGSEVWIASQVFGKPLSDCPSPDASLKQEISSGMAGMTNTEIQNLVNKYNQQVAAFNACIK